MLLFLNDIAGSEVLLILVFILIFFGSKSIPGIAKTFGKTMYQIKQASADLQDEIKKSGVDIKKDMNLTSFIQETVEEVQRPLDQQMVEMENIVNYSPPKKTPMATPEIPEAFEVDGSVESQIVEVPAKEVEVVKENSSDTPNQVN
jgi:sec-independent protein translocase protein TatA